MDRILRHTILIEKFNKSDSNVTRILADVNLHLFKNGGQHIPVGVFSPTRIIGSLMYLMSCIRLDIAYSMRRLSRYTSNLGSDQWKAIVRLLRYLRYTHDFGLHYTRYPAILEGDCVANWISDMKHSKSTSGYLFMLGSEAVS